MNNRVIELTDNGREFAREGALYKILEASKIEEKRLCDVAGGLAQSTEGNDFCEKLAKALRREFPELEVQAVSYDADGYLEVEMLDEEGLPKSLKATWDEVSEDWVLPNRSDLANKFGEYINFVETWRKSHEVHPLCKVHEWFNGSWKAMVIEVDDDCLDELLHARFVSTELEQKILEDYEAAGKVEEDGWHKTYAGRSFSFSDGKTSRFPGIDVLPYLERDPDDDEGDDMYFEDEFDEDDE
jgi:hypothetical protein